MKSSDQLWTEIHDLLKTEHQYLYVELEWFPINAHVHIVDLRTKTTTKLNADGKRAVRTICGFYVYVEDVIPGQVTSVVTNLYTSPPDNRKTCTMCNKVITDKFKQEYLKNG